MADRLKIRKEAIAVECCDARGQEFPGEVFVAPAQGRAGDERLQDLFATRRFVPLRCGDQTLFLSSAHLCWCRLALLDALAELDGEAEDAADAVSVGVEITLEGAGILRGFLRYLMPENARRLSDYMAQLPPFFPLRTADWLYLVNRDRVLRLMPVPDVAP